MKRARACEIMDRLVNVYRINDVNYYSIIHEIEFWFDEGYFDVDYGITHYSADDLPYEDVPDREHTEEIGNGFYFYIWYIGI